jgi:hypothetical protein
MRLDIDTTQVEVLREVLASQVKELSIEAARTDAHAYHEALVRRRQLLEEVLRRLDAGSPADETLANRLS